MKLTVQVQLHPDLMQSEILQVTVERFNEASNWLAAHAFERKLLNKFTLQKLFYSELRGKFGLPSDMAIRCIARVCEVSKQNKLTCPKFKKHSSVPYSMGRNVSFKGLDRVSISSINGRLIVPFVISAYQKEKFGWSKGQSDLMLRGDGKWFLLVTVDMPDGTPIEVKDFIGVDLGISNVAVDSTGEFHQGKSLESKRVSYASRRRALGRKTKGATRKTRRACHKAIVRMQKKESRYRRDLNHQISKKLVAKAKDTESGIALEDLTGICDRIQFRRQQRAKMGSWAFHQLRTFVEYKALMAGVQVVIVDPRNTSRTCSACNYCDPRNRLSQECFRCQSCGYECHADFNAARNIRSRARAVVNPPMEPERFLSARG